jgi:hypothetical protein
MSQPIAALAAFPARFQQALHGADRAMKLALIEQRRVDLGGRTVLKTILRKARQHCLLFGFRQSPRREPPPGRRPGKKTAAAPPVPSGSRHSQRLARWFHTHQRAELINRGHHDFSVSVIG